MSLENGLLIFSLIGMMFIIFPRIYNIMTLGKLFKEEDDPLIFNIKLCWVLFSIGILLWFFSWLVYATDLQDLTFRALFRTISLLSSLSIILLFIEHIIYIRDKTANIIQSNNPKPSATDRGDNLWLMRR